MSIPRSPHPAKLVVGMFMGDKHFFHPMVSDLVRTYGAIDMVSPWLPFDDTDYYAEEMGSPLFRRFAVFSELMEQDQLAAVKQRTNALEEKLSQQGKRIVNVDPGYVVPERFVLGTGKNYTHRIYLNGGIYADLTLVYHKGDFRPLAWTYPDYAGEPIRGFLRLVRARYMYQLRVTGSIC
jgi:hypothetical protein